MSRFTAQAGTTSPSFADRAQAGRRLAEKIIALDTERHGQLGQPASCGIISPEAPPVVLALPRGGVPVGFEVAAALQAPLDVLLVRKIGAPGNPELGMGAIAEGGVRVLSEEVLRGLLVSEQELEHGVAKAEAEMRRRVRIYRDDRAPVPLQGASAIIVDDGLATGGTARAAVRAARARGAARVLIATPVGAPSTVRALRKEADEVICVLEAEPMVAIGMWYRDFGQIPDHEVIALLAQARPRWQEAPARSRASPQTPVREEPAWDRAPKPTPREQVTIPYEGDRSTLGDLSIPEPCRCLVLFAHGSGSGRRSPRNRQVASALNERGIATLLFDLLSGEEELSRANVFDIPLLASRLAQATRWAHAQPQLAALPIGYFGASTGAAAALGAATEMPDDLVGAVVSRGGRPDLAPGSLEQLKAPVLLIVGGADSVVLDLNRQALSHLPGPAELVVLPGATHLFEEPGALEEVARLAADWLRRHLGHGGERMAEGR